MVFLQPLVDIAVYYATGKPPRSLDKEKLVRLHKIIEDFIVSNDVNQIESTMQDISKEGCDPKCIPKIFKIMQVRPCSESDQPSNSATGHSERHGIDGGPIHRHRSAPWSTEEDERLIAGIFHFGLSDWQKVSSFVGKGRTRSQCGQRWLRCLDPNVNKDKWTPEEDEKLKKLVEVYGSRSWARIAKELGNRTDVQCRYRFVRCNKEMKTFPTNNLQKNAELLKQSNQIIFAQQQQQQQIQNGNDLKNTKNAQRVLPPLIAAPLHLILKNNNNNLKAIMALKNDGNNNNILNHIQEKAESNKVLPLINPKVSQHNADTSK